LANSLTLTPRLSNLQSRLIDTQMRFLEAQKTTEERVNELITLVNDLLRHLPLS